VFRRKGKRSRLRPRRGSGSHPVSGSEPARISAPRGSGRPLLPERGFGRAAAAAGKRSNGRLNRRTAAIPGDILRPTFSVSRRPYCCCAAATTIDNPATVCRFAFTRLANSSRGRPLLSGNGAGKRKKRGGPAKCVRFT